MCDHLFLHVFKILEKMRPLDHKLKYQIDKLVRTAVTGSLGRTLPEVCAGVGTGVYLVW